MSALNHKSDGSGNDSDDSDDLHMCGNPDELADLFKKCKSGLFAGQSPVRPKLPDEPEVKEDDVDDEDEKRSRKKPKLDTNAAGSDSDVQELSSSEAELSPESNTTDSDDPDVLKIFEEYDKAVKEYNAKVASRSPKKTHLLAFASASASTPKTKTRKTVPLNTKNMSPNTRKRVIRATRLARATRAACKKFGHDPNLYPMPKLVTIDSDDDNAKTEEAPIEREEKTLRVRWKGQIHKLKLFVTDGIFRVKEMLSAETGGTVSPYDILLYNDSDMPLEDLTAIEDAQIEFTTILDAVRKAPKAVAVASSSKSKVSKAPEEELRPNDPNVISLIIQDDNLRSKSTTLYVKKTVPLTNLAEMYIYKTGMYGEKTASQIKFMYDGEMVNLRKTPDALGFEDDECLDVVVK